MPKKSNDPLTCSKCKASKPDSKYFPYCSAEHWGKAVNSP